MEVGLEMWDEIFKFESFINFVNFFHISRPLFEIFIEILYFNYNSPITQKMSSSLTTAKGQWPEEQHNDTYTFILF